jgi:hypothetical protein
MSVAQLEAKLLWLETEVGEALQQVRLIQQAQKLTPDEWRSA